MKAGQEEDSLIYHIQQAKRVVQKIKWKSMIATAGVNLRNRKDVKMRQEGLEGWTWQRMSGYRDERTEGWLTAWTSLTPQYKQGLVLNDNNSLNGLQVTWQSS